MSSDKRWSTVIYDTKAQEPQIRDANEVFWLERLGHEGKPRPGMDKPPGNITEKSDKLPGEIDDS